MEKKLLRWGILGAADIARKNWKAIWNSGNGIVAAVASRDMERARRFVSACQAQASFQDLPRIEQDYEKLLAAPDIDAVYTPLPTAPRKLWVERAAAAGNHVVCEKPCAVSLADLSQMLEACRRHRVQFMDGVMFIHSRRLEKLGELLADGQTIGPIRRITSAFTFGQTEDFFASNIRARSELEPDGCLGDLGWYCIRFILWAMGWRLPRQVTGRILSERRHSDSRDPIPIDFSGELLFDDGVSGSFYCSFLTGIEQWATVSGTRGHLHVRDFVLPFSGSRISFETGNPHFEVAGCDFDMQPRRRRWTVSEFSHGHPNAQETNLFRHFADQVLSGQLNSAWPDMALRTQQVMQACRQSAAEEGAPTEVNRDRQSVI